MGGFQTPPAISGLITKARLIRIPGHLVANLDRQAARAAAIASG